MRNYLLRIFSLKPFTKKLLFMTKVVESIEQKLSESDEAGAKYCPFRFFIGKQK